MITMWPSGKPNFLRSWLATETPAALPPTMATLYFCCGRVGDTTPPKMHEMQANRPIAM